MKKIFYILIIVLSLNYVVMADFEDSHIEIKYTELDENGEEHVIGSSGWNCGLKNAMTSIYYKTDNNGVGISGGSYVDDDVTFEMPYSLRIIKYPDRMILSGVFRGYNVNGNKITSGIRKVIYEDIEYDKPIYVHIAPSENDSETKITITLYKKELKSKVVFNGPISLITNLLNNSVCKSHTQGVISEKVEFLTRDGKNREDGYFESAKIISKILLPNYPKNLDEPFQTELTFRRIYKIDTLYVSEREFSVDVTYSSEYKEKVELIPGKMLMLVFPADTPSVRGFDRVDTLYIRP